jgi:hypothetical protein
LAWRSDWSEPIRRMARLIWRWLLTLRDAA